MGFHSPFSESNFGGPRIRYKVDGNYLQMLTWPSVNLTCDFPKPGCNSACTVFQLIFYVEHSMEYWVHFD